MADEDELSPDSLRTAHREKIAAAKRDRIADLGKQIAERQDPRSDLSKWFCPAEGDFGCSGPRCPRFYVSSRINCPDFYQLRCDFGRGSRNP